MRSFLILAFFGILVSNAFAVCDTPISRTNFSASSVLSSTKLNLDFNTLYTHANELPGDCIEAESISTTEILNGTLLNADISSVAEIDRSKLEKNVASSSTVASVQVIGTSIADVTGLSASITTDGGAVLVTLYAGTTNGNVSFGSTDEDAYGYVLFVRGSTVLTKIYAGTLSTGATAVTSIHSPSSFSFVDTPGAGTYTYKVQAAALETLEVASFTDVYLSVREL